MKKLLAILAFLLAFSACNHVPAPTKAGEIGVRADYTPLTVEPNVYKLAVNGDEGWTGTGWMVQPGYMMTAGHVCDGADEVKAISRWNAEYPVKVIKFTRTPDLCLLDAKDVPGAGLDDFVRVPEYSSEIWYLGAPNGLYGDGTAPFAKGFYIGGKRMMIAGYPGASGSPVFTKDGVVGILVRGFRGTHLVEFETAADIALFLKE
jgi:hypothetical protein